MKAKLVGTMLIVGAFCSPAAKCQVAAATSKVAAQSATSSDATAFLTLMGPSTLDRAVGGVGNAAQITASTDSSNATIQLSRKMSDPQNNKFSTFTLTASAAVDQSSDRTDLATLDGLQDAFTLATKFTWFQMSSRRNPAGDQKLLDTSLEICNEMNETYKIRTGNSDEPNCDTDNVKKYMPSRYVEFRNLFIDPNGWLVSFGIEPKVGYKKFTFLDATTLNKMSDSKNPWSVEAFLGFAPSRWQTLITIGANYQSGFKDADSGILCPPSSGNGPVACKTGAVGKPVSDDAELLYVELRHQFAAAGVSLKVTHDFKESLTGVDLPITFIKGQDGSLTGGFRVGWNNTSHWQAGVFVGKAFSLFDS